MPEPAPPQTQEEVLLYYRDRQQTLRAEAAAFRTRRGRVVRWTLIAMLFLSFAPKYHLSQPLTVTLLLLELPLTIALIWIASKHTAQISRRDRLLLFHDHNLLRADGTEPQSGRTGLEPGQNLRVPGHLYDRDLNLLGPDSLFGLLSSVRTGPGERGLAQYLLQPAPHAQTVLRQQAVRELLPQTDLRERIALLGTSRFHQLSAAFFDDWLDDPAPTLHPAWRIALLTTAILDIALLLAGLTHLRPWGTLLPNFALVLAIQSGICLRLRTRALPLLTGSARLQQHIKLIAEGLALLQFATFTSPKLVELQRLSREPAGAVKLLQRLDSHLSIVEQRTKEYFFVLSLLLAAGTQAAISIARWKHRYAPALRLWLAAWSEFEALNALANYAFEHPADAWPTLLPPEHPPLYEAAALAHPLLPTPISNDISLSAPHSVPHSSQFHRNEWVTATDLSPRFLLISGSNMSGKSTLLRSIGINAVLAYAGAPVRAASLRLTPLALGASLALTDSLAEGRSKFLAEVERLAAIVRLSASTPVLFLVDEIFSGTNSADRRTAAAAVLHRLLANGAIGALSTHDLALTALATRENGGQNVHMASPNPGDPLAFDYTLKPGVNTTSNALAIVRMMGLDA